MKYCRTHHVYYDSVDGGCPICGRSDAADETADRSRGSA